jgi:hypothetical protein
MNGFQKKIRTAFTVTFAVLGLSLSATGHAADHENQALFDKTHGVYNQLLQDNVKNGMVNYAALVEAHDGSLSILTPYLESLAEVAQDDFETWVVSDQLAFMVNLYNAATLQLIVDHYPVDSIKEIGWWGHNAWKKKIINLFGRHISLDYLEHDIIRAQFQEPEIHFALVCAAKGCPELRSEAYVGPKLVEQFDDQSRIFLADSNKNRFDDKNGKIYLSNIFRWYGEDFAKDNVELLAVLQEHWPEEVQAQLRQHNFKAIDINYTQYDWSLNEMNDASLSKR